MVATPTALFASDDLIVLDDPWNQSLDDIYESVAPHYDTVEVHIPCCHYDPGARDRTIWWSVQQDPDSWGRVIIHGEVVPSDKTKLALAELVDRAMEALRG